MQISSNLQNNFTTPINTEFLKNTPENSQNNLTKEITPINKDAYNYVDLGENISAYTTAVDPVQEQTNKELISYLSTIMNDKTDEGKKNLKAYDLTLYHPVDADKKTIWGYDDAHPEEFYSDRQTDLTYWEPTEYEKTHPYTVFGDGMKIIKRMTFQELYDFLGQDYFGKNTSRKESIAIADRMSVFPVTLTERQRQYIQELPGPTESFSQGVSDIQTVYTNNLRQTTKERFDAIQVEKFKNLYSFSDAFAKTDKFQELYANYVNQNNNNKQIEDARTHGKSMAETFGSKSFFTSQVSSQNLSKSEIIEHYSKISQDIQILRIPPKDTTYGETYIKKIDDSIKIYDTIINDLKKMWNYGDLDVKS
ncbi:hypothetical protein [Sulfurospirillum arsenophilum]|uniref:hypothetical protein n=1 Tax=Sulfurospirillum arsenophilum TaxID=56698 RepID=UPI0005A6296F|nr:hypothetical protein [Sulfurospirillum arsenophilum]